MNILITGIHGFVGSNLVSALKEQPNIYGLVFENMEHGSASGRTSNTDGTDASAALSTGDTDK